MLAHEREQLVGRGRFAGDGLVVGLGEDLPKALSDNGVIIGNGDPDHVDAPRLIMGQPRSPQAMNDSRTTNRILLVCAAILTAIPAVVVWKECVSVLQTVPGFLALLLVALLARFFAFLAAMIASVILALGFWFVILPNAFPSDSTALMTLRLSLFLLA